MEVRMKTHIGGYRNGEPWPAIGGTIDVDDREAAELVAQRYAEYLVPPNEEHDASETAEPDGDPADEPDGDPEADDDASETAEPDDYDGLSHADLVATAEARGVTIDGRWSKARIIEALTAPS